MVANVRLSAALFTHPNTSHHSENLIKGWLPLNCKTAPEFNWLKLHFIKLFQILFAVKYFIYFFMEEGQTIFKVVSNIRSLRQKQNTLTFSFVWKMSSRRYHFQFCIVIFVLLSGSGGIHTKCSQTMKSCLWRHYRFILWKCFSPTHFIDLILKTNFAKVWKVQNFLISRN